MNTETNYTEVDERSEFLGEFQERLRKLDTSDVVVIRSLVADELSARTAAEQTRFIDSVRDQAYSLGLEIRVSSLKNQVLKEIKYRNPDNSKQTWSGRGTMPKWFKEKLASGVERIALLAVGAE